jgi:hypothetical protein
MVSLHSPPIANLSNSDLIAKAALDQSGTGRSFEIKGHNHVDFKFVTHCDVEKLPGTIVAGFPLGSLNNDRLLVKPISYGDHRVSSADASFTTRSIRSRAEGMS